MADNERHLTENVTTRLTDNIKATSRQLTQTEVEALPAGTKILVTWSGGNGPWSYVIREARIGNKTIYSSRSGVFVEYVKGLVVGPTQPFTQVWLDE